ncbi:MAG: hypothetical protein M3431_11090 [Actinomycetota bacterium]|nr:hypothetical protein [Actinomycetota bacterium]
MSVEDKQPYINHARDIYELLTRLPHDVEERAHDLALHHARQIVSFYEHFDLSDADALVYRDACAAENLKWWHERSGDRIASGRRPPTANAPELRNAIPPAPDMSFPSAGSYLRNWYGERYLSIGSPSTTVMWR